MSLPNEFSAVRAEGGLAQERGHELMSVHLVHASSHGTAAAVEAGALLELAARAPLAAALVAPATLRAPADPRPARAHGHGAHTGRLGRLGWNYNE